MPDYNATTADGYVGRDSGQVTWTAARDTADGQSVATGGLSENIPQSTFTGAVYYNYRYFLYFDTSSIPSTASLVSAAINLYCTSTANSNSTTVEIVASTQGDTLATGDYDAYTNTSIGSKAISGFSTSAYNSITITDLTKITKAGTTKLALLTGNDLNNSAPTGANSISINTGNAASNKPYLSIVYTLPSSNSLFFAQI